MAKQIEIEEKELWNLDSTLADIIHQYLVAFKKSERLGVLYSHMFEEPDFSYEKYEYMVTNDTDWFLDELIWTFEVLSNGGVDNIPEVDVLIQEVFGAPDAMTFEKSETGLASMTFNLDEEKHAELRALEKHYQERINRGLAMFAKYFQSLWD